MNPAIFDVFCWDLKEIEPGLAFSQLVHDHLPQFSTEFKYYFPTTKATPPPPPWTGKNLDPWPICESARWAEWSMLPWVWVNCLRSQMRVAFKFHISIHSGLKSRQNMLRMLQKHWRACLCFQHPIFLKQGLLWQWQQTKWDQLDISIGCHCLPSLPERTIWLQENKFRATTAITLWWVVQLFLCIFHYIMK